MKRKIRAALLALAAAALLFGPPAKAAERAPELVVTGGQTPTLIPGGTQTVTFTLSNNGTADARDIRISFPNNPHYTARGEDVSGEARVAALAVGAGAEVSITVETHNAPPGPLSITMNVTCAYAVWEPEAPAPGQMPERVEKSQSMTLTLYAAAAGDAQSASPLMWARLSSGYLTAGQSVLLEIALDTSVPLANGKSIQAVVLEGPALATNGFVLADAAAYTLAQTGQQAERRIRRDGDYLYLTYALRVTPYQQTGTYTFSVGLLDDASATRPAQTELVDCTVLVGQQASVPETKLVLEDIRQSAQKPDANGQITLELYVRNAGGAPIENITLDISGLSGAGLSLPAATLPPALADIFPGETAVLPLKLQVSKQASSGAYVLEFAIKAGAVRLAGASYACIVSQTPPAATQTPRPPAPVYLLLDAHAVLAQTGDIRAGQPFTLELTLKNTSAAQDILDLKVRVASADGMLTPAQNALSEYVALLKAGQTHTLRVDMLAASQATTRNYEVLLYLAYADTGGETHAEEAIALSLPVVQPPRLELGELQLETGTSGAPTPITLNLRNLGRIAVYNINVRPEGPFAFAGGESLFYGNLGAGTADFMEDALVPLEAGALEGAIVLEYEDVNGYPYTYAYPIRMQAEQGENAYTPGGWQNPDLPGGDGGGATARPGGGISVMPVPIPRDVQVDLGTIRVGAASPAQAVAVYPTPYLALALIPVAALGTCVLVFLLIRRKKRAANNGASKE